MQTSENFEISIGKEPGKKIDPEQDLLDDIANKKKEVEMYERMSKEYQEARMTGNERDIPAAQYEVYAGADHYAQAAREELEALREELEALLAA